MTGPPMTIDLTHLKQLAVSENGFVFDPYTGHTFTLNATGIAVLAEWLLADLLAGY